MSSTGADLAALGLAASQDRRVARSLRDERADLRAAIAQLAGASGLRAARLACDEAGEVLLRALDAVHDGTALLADDAALQRERFARADRR